MSIETYKTEENGNIDYSLKWAGVVWIILEIHIPSCDCSFCKGSNSKLKYGLNLPKNKSGWKTIKYWRGRYLRWI